MTVVLAAALALVVAHCLVRVLRPGPARAGRSRALGCWHAVMGASMVAMLLGWFPRPAAAATLALAVLGLGWSAVVLLRRDEPAPPLRLAVGWAAMIAMVLPLVTAPAVAATGPAPGPAPGHGEHPGTMAHAGHQMTAGGAGLPVPLLAVVLVALVAVALSRLRVLVDRRRGDAGERRLDAVGDVVMVAAMVSMLVPLTA